MTGPHLHLAATVWPEQIQLPIAEQNFFSRSSCSQFISGRSGKSAVEAESLRDEDQEPVIHCKLDLRHLAAAAAALVAKSGST
jgi:hypothetical protein